MDLILIEKLMRLLENSALEELDVTQDGVHIRLAKSVRGAGPAGGRAETPEMSAEAQIAEVLALPHENAGREHRVVAGLIGTFYRASAPDAAVFVEEGDRVEDGQTLGLLEAMKTFNPVEADCAGRITAILVADGASVEAGTPLFLIEKEA